MGEKIKSLEYLTSVAPIKLPKTKCRTFNVCKNTIPLSIRLTVDEIWEEEGSVIQNMQASPLAIALPASVVSYVTVQTPSDFGLGHRFTHSFPIPSQT